jgi:hypothetical protein
MRLALGRRRSSNDPQTSSGFSLLLGIEALALIRRNQ